MPRLTSRLKNYSKWYNELILKSGLAEISEIKGCMIIKPYGLAIWENIKKILNKMFKNTGHENIYFPLFIPKSYFSKESCHIKGFAKECAIVTHYRLKNDFKSKKIIVDPKYKLKDELIIRPTSETIVWNTYKRWIKSYRDLPILLNQWSNVVRWEMRTRLFLRTSEFLWQEGHTAHSTKKEAINETKQMLYIYKKLLEKYMCIPVIEGIKTQTEKFAGAEKTYSIEAIMQDGKALQIGTSHFLGQNFSKAFNVKFTNKLGVKEYPWATSWGVSTRLIGALIMVHSDDKGLIIPPIIAPIQIVIIPIYKNNDQLNDITNYVLMIKKILKKKGVRVKYDDNKFYTPGWKFNEYEMKGIPINISIGPKEIKENTIEITRRDNFNKLNIPKDKIEILIPYLLKKIQKNIFYKAMKRHNNNLTKVETYEKFKYILKNKGGFILAHWNGSKEIEKKIKIETNATIRCIPLKMEKENGKCIFSGNSSKQRVIFAKSY